MDPQTSTLVFPRDAAAAALSQRRETDATTALARGLKEYLEVLSIDWPETGKLRFTKVFDRYADFEDGLEFPRAVAYSAEAIGEYNGQLGQWPEGNLFTGESLPVGGGVILEALDELVIDLTVELEVSNPEERIGLVAMLEDAFRPYPGASGFMLTLPHYYNTRGRYTAGRIQYLDSPEDPARNYRRARTVIQSRIPVIVSHTARPLQEMRQGGTITTNVRIPPPAPPTVTRGKI